MRKSFDLDSSEEPKKRLTRYATANYTSRWPGIDVRRISDSEDDDTDYNVPIEVDNIDDK